MPGVEEEKHKAVMRILWANRFFMMMMPKIVINYDFDMLVLLLLIRKSGVPSRLHYKKNQIVWFPTVSQPYFPINEQEARF